MKSTHRHNLIITIDGPAGVGKTTVSSLLAKKLGFLYLESGALYRALALKVLRFGKKITPSIPKILKYTRIDIVIKAGKASIVLDGEVVDPFLREEAVGTYASKISQLKEVRAFLLEVQRQLGKKHNLVAEGRDMGSVVFPHADFKFYMDADPSIRVERRFLEVKKKKKDILKQEIKEKLTRRDQEDFQRAHSPLIIPKNSIIINTSNITVDEVVEKIYALVVAR